MRRDLRSLAAAGNAAALVLLALVLLLRGVLFEAPPPPRPPSPAPPPPHLVEGGARRTLLVVFDAVGAGSVPRMPVLSRLAGEGGRGTARVEALVPSTIAGIRALAEGVVPPPASFLGDFGAARAPAGGIFAAARQAGLRSFVAGPRLWRDLYGPWLDGSRTVETFGSRDELVLRAAERALRADYDLIVVHLHAPDEAAHRSGTASRRYERALASCDAALGRLLSSAGPETAVVVTSDHGVVASGGHAGPEEEVRAVPLAVRGPGLPSGDLGTLRQRDLHRLILLPLGLSLDPVEPPATPPDLAPMLLLLPLALALLRSVALQIEPPWTAGLLDSTLWLALALALAGVPAAALLLPFLALAFPLVGWGRFGSGASRGATGSAAGAHTKERNGTPRTRTGWWLPCALALTAGAAFGVLRLDDGAALAFVLLPLLPWLPPLPAGAACAFFPAAFASLLGETVSLSTLDVRLAFLLADGPFGLAGAATAAALRQGLPALLAAALLFVRLRSVAPFATGLAAAICGQAAVAAILLPAGGLALGLLVRLIGELAFLFLGGALVLVLRRRAVPTRRPAATPP